MANYNFYFTAPDHQNAPRTATKDDYIYIPLKSPHNQQQRQSGPPQNSGKPPLPRTPPRIVGASVKQRNDGRRTADNHQRRRTIDSAAAAADSRPRPMEPMGLIETDLDTEVTTVRTGAAACSSNVKTARSLLNLGAEPRLGAPQHEGDASDSFPKGSRPHKSMEFLLDKQNHKVVEVRLFAIKPKILFFG